MNAYSKLLTLMAKQGYNKAIDIQLGTVKSPLPDLSVRLDGVEFTLGGSDLVLTGVSAADGYLQTNDRIIIACLDESQMFVVLDKAVIL